MKTIRNLFTTISIFAAMLCLMIASASADSLTLPASLQTIGDEAFYGDSSIDEVILPEGIKTIGERAFAESSITSIYLPSSINSIADFAFQNTSVVGTGIPGTYAQEWFKNHGFEYIVLTTPIEYFEWETNVDGSIRVCFKTHNDITKAKKDAKAKRNFLDSVE